MVWLVKDGCGIACAILAWALMAFSQYALLTIILLPQPDSTSKYAHIIIFELFTVLTLVAHFRTILTDPGSVPQKTATPELIQGINNSRNYDYDPQQQQQQQQQQNNVIYKCSECCSVKPDRAHHCSVCKRCIRKMDHHCPWVNNCVGERNQKYFVLFTLYVTIISSHTLYLTISQLISCMDADWRSPESVCPFMGRTRPSPGRLIMLLFLTFESILFSLFSLVMFSIQMRAIWMDWTGIENLKKENRRRRSGCKSLESVFGGNVLLWLSPFTRPPSNASYANDHMTTRTNYNCPV